MVAYGWRRCKDWGGISTWSGGGGLFSGDEDVLKSIEVIVVPICEYTKSTKIYALNG